MGAALVALRISRDGGGKVSLRLGPLAVLTPHRGVIHCRSCRFATPPYDVYSTYGGAVGEGLCVVPFAQSLRADVGIRPYEFYQGWCEIVGGGALDAPTLRDDVGIVPYGVYRGWCMA